MSFVVFFHHLLYNCRLADLEDTQQSSMLTYKVIYELRYYSLQKFKTIIFSYFYRLENLWRFSGAFGKQRQCFCFFSGENKTLVRYNIFLLAADTYAPRRSACLAPPPASSSDSRSPSSGCPGFPLSGAPDMPSGGRRSRSRSGAHRWGGGCGSGSGDRGKTGEISGERRRLAVARRWHPLWRATWARALPQPISVILPPTPPSFIFEDAGSTRGSRWHLTPTPITHHTVDFMVWHFHNLAAHSLLQMSTCVVLSISIYSIYWSGFEQHV